MATVTWENMTQWPTNDNTTTIVYGPSYYVYTVGEVVIALLIIFGNLLVLIAIYRENQLQTTTNYFLVSLALSDLMVGLLGIPCTMVAFNGQPSNFEGCLFMNVIIIILTQISIFGLFAVALERFFAIRYPFIYNESCTTSLAIAVSVVVWVAGILVGSVPMFGWNLKSTYNGHCTFTNVVSMSYMVYFNFFGFVLVPLLFMLAIYIYIFVILHRQVREIQALQAAGQRHVVVVDDDSARDGRQHRSHVSELSAKEVKAAKWFAIIILTFALCWLPIEIQNCISYFAGVTCGNCVLLAVLLSHINSAINPVLYNYSNSKFKLAFRRMFSCCCNNTVAPREMLSTTKSPAMFDTQHPHSRHSGAHSLHTLQ